MRLSHLEMIGFKSFSTRLKVKFSDGITAVVGPNGCGKSNIVDAIRWALGEHRATSLRGDRMEDIIFNGTAARKPLGMAEVSLTIDNSEQKLPVEYSEVTITRRYFRSGASEYQINKVPCRLKDITNLLLDTGMGAHAYSIIEQGMVESVVNGSPLERRQLIEEAAGINKYKTRRRLAQRKLEGTEHDLVRIADLLDEVERSVSTLRRQVRKYERYERLMQQMKDVEIVVACHAFQDLRRQTEPVRERIRQFAERKEAIQTRIRTAEAEVEKGKAVQLEKEEKLQQRQDAVNQIDDQIRALEEELLVSKERRTGLEQRAQSASGEAEQAETELENIRSQLARIGDDRKTLETALEQARATFAERGRGVPYLRRPDRSAEGSHPGAAGPQHGDDSAALERARGDQFARSPRSVPSRAEASRWRPPGRNSPKNWHRRRRPSRPCKRNCGTSVAWWMRMRPCTRT